MDVISAALLYNQVCIVDMSQTDNFYGFTFSEIIKKCITGMDIKPKYFIGTG